VIFLFSFLRATRFLFSQATGEKGQMGVSPSLVKTESEETESEETDEKAFKYQLSSEYISNCSKDEVVNMFMEAVAIENYDVIEAFLVVDQWPKAKLNRSSLLFGKHGARIPAFLYIAENYRAGALQNILSIMIRIGLPTIQSINANGEIVVAAIDRILLAHDDYELTNQVMTLFSHLFQLMDFASKYALESLKLSHYCSLKTLLDAGVCLPRKIDGEMLIHILMMFDLDDNVKGLLRRQEMKDQMLTESPEGNTPLHFAVSFGNEEMTKFLIQEMEIQVPQDLKELLEGSNGLWRNYGRLKQLIREQDVQLIEAQLSVFEDLCNYVDLSDFCILRWIDHSTLNPDLCLNLLGKFTFVYEDFIWGQLLNNCNDKYFILKALKSQDKNLKLLIFQGQKSPNTALSRFTLPLCKKIISFAVRSPLASCFQEEAMFGKGFHVFQRRNRQQIFKQFLNASISAEVENDNPF
jgi:hypothetical protein